MPWSNLYEWKICTTFLHCWRIVLWSCQIESNLKVVLGQIIKPVPATVVQNEKLWGTDKEQSAALIVSTGRYAAAALQQLIISRQAHPLSKALLPKWVGCCFSFSYFPHPTTQVLRSVHNGPRVQSRKQPNVEPFFCCSLNIWCCRIGPTHQSSSGGSQVATAAT